MQEKTPQEYANELLQMYRANAQEIRNIDNYEQQKSNHSSDVSEKIVFEDGTGGLQVNVTTLGRLYPVKNALVTIFTGQKENMSVIETAITDESGKSDVFNLKTPQRDDSLQAENGGVLPYANYNISVQSDGYVEQIAMNVPVFSGVVSVQGIDLLPITVAGSHTAPQIFDEQNKYNL